MNELALFAGAGGGILGGKLLGWTTVCAVERDAFAASVLIARQNEGLLAPFPIWDDVCTFDGRPWRGLVDVVSGGFPCQGISPAGKGEGLDDERSGLWSEMRRVVGEVRPGNVLVENSPALTFRGLGTVLGDLATLGYDARWCVLGAEDAIWDNCDPFTDHERARIWIRATAHDDRNHRGSPRTNRTKGRPAKLHHAGIPPTANALRERRRQVESSIAGRPQGEEAASAFNHGDRATRRTWWATEPDVGRMVHGVASRVDRLRGLGNGQVPAVVALAWETLSK